jgi:hypothetical protein
MWIARGVWMLLSIIQRSTRVLCRRIDTSCQKSNLCMLARQNSLLSNFCCHDCTVGTFSFPHYLSLGEGGSHKRNNVI